MVAIISAVALGALLQSGFAEESHASPVERYQAASPLAPLPSALRGREEEFLAAWDRARERLEAFARDHNLDPPELDDVRLMVVAAQSGLRRGSQQTRPTTVATAGWKSIHVVTPEVFTEVLPEYASARDDAWARLLAHELFHLWIRVGPRWFREGLAIVAADQGIGDDLSLSSPDPTLASLDWQNDGDAYRRSAAQVRFYLDRIPLRELLGRASSSDFETWLQNRWQRGPDTSQWRI